MILVQENRSYDHYFGRLAEAGQPDAERIPTSFGNPDGHGHWVTPFHLPSTCVPADPPHQWSSMHAHWNQGRMDGFVVEAARAKLATGHGARTPGSVRLTGDNAGSRAGEGRRAGETRRGARHDEAKMPRRVGVALCAQQRRRGRGR